MSRDSQAASRGSSCRAWVPLTDRHDLCSTLLVSNVQNLYRSFSALPTLRPTATPARADTIFSRRPTTLLQAFTPTTTTIAAAEGLGETTTTPADVVPRSAITTHPALAHTQIRCGPRRYMNMNRPSRLIRQRRHGFLSRIRSKDGRKTLMRRRVKGRKMLSA